MPKADPMQKELEQKLAERWPAWFNVRGDARYTRMADGFCHGDGWFNILWRLCEDLELLVADFEAQTGQRFEVLQVKEKLGGLRFYVSCRNDAIHKRIAAAELESLAVCELCGQSGKRRETGWIRTLCDDHAGRQGAGT